MIAKPQAAVAALFILAMSAMAGWLALHMPPVHWLLFVIPAAGAGFWVLFAIAPWITPRGQNLLRSPGAYGTIWLAVTSLFGVAFSVVVAKTPRVSWPGQNVFLGAFGAALIVMGNVVGKLSRNHIAGFRTPWALADDDVWDKTQRFGGWCLVISGFVLINAALLFNANFARGILIAMLVATAILSMFASWRFAQQKKNARK